MDLTLRRIKLTGQRGRGVGKGTAFTVLPWGLGVDKSHGNAFGMGTIMQQIAALKLRNTTTKCLFCSLCRYQCLLAAW